MAIGGAGIAGVQLALLVLRAGRLVMKEIELMNLDLLPPELRAELIVERDGLNEDLARLNRLGQGQANP